MVNDRINDFIPAIQLKVKPKRELLHAKVIRELLIALRMMDYDVINYDHITLSIPKRNFPLELEGKRYDIVATDGNYLIYLEVKTRKIEKTKLKEILRNGKG